MNSLVKLIKFIQNNKPSATLTFTVINERAHTGLEIEWLPLEDYAHWRYREINSSEWIDLTIEQLVSITSRYQIDTNIFNQDLKNLILKNVEEHYLIINQAKKLLRPPKAYIKG